MGGGEFRSLAARFDADGNGTIDFADFLTFRARFGTSIP